MGRRNINTDYENVKHNNDETTEDVYKTYRLVDFLKSLNDELLYHSNEIELFSQLEKGKYIEICHGVDGLKSLYWGRLYLKESIGKYNAVHVMPYVIRPDNFKVRDGLIHPCDCTFKDYFDIDNDSGNIHCKKFDGFQFVLVSNDISKADNKCLSERCKDCNKNRICNGFTKPVKTYGPGLVVKNGKLDINKICYSSEVKYDNYPKNCEEFFVNDVEVFRYLNEFVISLYKKGNDKDVDKTLILRRVNDVHELVNVYCRIMSTFDKSYKAKDKSYNMSIWLSIGVCLFVSVVLLLIIFLIKKNLITPEGSLYVLVSFGLLLIALIFVMKRKIVCRDFEKAIIDKSESVLINYGVDMENSEMLKLLADISESKTTEGYEIFNIVINIFFPISVSAFISGVSPDFSLKLYYILLYCFALIAVIHASRKPIMEKYSLNYLKQHRILIETCQKRIWNNEMNKRR